MGVMSDHNARAFGAAARAFRRAAGTLGSGSSPDGAISSVARKGKSLMVPSTVVMPREGSFALASFGRVRKVQEPNFAVAAGRKSFALKRILEAVLVMFAWCH